MRELPSSAPSLNPALVVTIGATALRNVFSADQLDDILLAYIQGIKVTFAITVAALGISFLLSLLSKWKRINAEELTGGAA